MNFLKIQYNLAPWYNCKLHVINENPLSELEMLRLIHYYNIRSF